LDVLKLSFYNGAKHKRKIDEKIRLSDEEMNKKKEKYKHTMKLPEGHAMLGVGY
jgi:hypothetical protein